jgi:hypothetical protein
MKQKYEIVKDEDAKRLIIREYAELDKDVMSLLCEESYDKKAVKSAISSGRESLVTALRTKNLYPPGLYAGKIADKVMEMYGAKGKMAEEIVFDDLEFLAQGHEAAETAVSYEGEVPEIDDLLEVGLEEDKFEEGEDVKKIDSSLKIEDDEFADIDDES